MATPEPDAAAELAELAAQATRADEGVTAIITARLALSRGVVPMPGDVSGRDPDLITQAMFLLAAEGDNPRRRAERLALAAALIAADLDAELADRDGLLRAVPGGTTIRACRALAALMSRDADTADAELAGLKPAQLDAIARAAARLSALAEAWKTPGQPTEEGRTP